MKAKYQYTHFIYPFVVEEGKYFNFIKSLVCKEKDWKLKIHNYYEDKQSYDFFLPYMRKFLFPTLFWDKNMERKYKIMNEQKKAINVASLSCTTFEYRLESIKTGDIVYGKQAGIIHFDISEIKLFCFKSGICFLDIRAEVDNNEGLIDFNQILDFNFSFRNLTPRAVSNKNNVSELKGKNIDKIEDIALLIKSIIDGFETDDVEKIYYDKMFTYSYVCVDGWNVVDDFNKYKNDFLKFQYVMSTKSSAIFNDDNQKLKDNIYSMWNYSMFGFTVESGVVFVSDKEKYNITKMPYNFEKKYFYVLLLALYQRISLINFSQDLLKTDRNTARRLNRRFTQFTHFSWFSQITNSENGMNIWEKWQKAFKLQQLFDEVHKQYIEYYDLIRVSNQEKFNIVLMFTYMVNISFSGISLLASIFDFRYYWLRPIIIILMIVGILSYPLYILNVWLKDKDKIKDKY